MKVRTYTWAEFDEAVASVRRPAGDSLYAIPRGGYPFAVALSHRWNMKLLSSPNQNSILVDDIADSGETIARVREEEFECLPAVTILKRYDCDTTNLYFDELLRTDVWIVFPWEDKLKASEDYAAYISS